MRHTRSSFSSWLLRVGSVLLALATPASALARDLWTEPYAGVRHLHRRTDKADLHLMLIDLSRPEVSVVTTREAESGMQVSEFARRYDAQIAINANYFDSRFNTCGMAASNGEIWSGGYAEGCDMSLAFGALNEATAFDSSAVLHGPMAQDWAREIVSGKPWLVRDGIVQGGWEAPRHIHVRHPRTAIGLSEDRRTLLLAVVDGRRSTAIGMNGNELAALMAEFGAHNALNLDGGGSTELFVAGEGGRQNRVSGGVPRGVGNHLGIRIKSDARWVGATLEHVEAIASTVPGGKAHVRMTYRNSGRRAWTLSGEDAVSLAIDNGRPSALWDPDGWISTTVASRAHRMVAPGDSYTFEFDAAAPAVPGTFSASFVPLLADGTALAAAHAVDVRVDDIAQIDVAPADAMPSPSSIDLDEPVVRQQANVTGIEARSSSWLLGLVFASVLGIGYKISRVYARRNRRNRRVFSA